MNVLTNIEIIVCPMMGQPVKRNNCVGLELKLAGDKKMAYFYRCKHIVTEHNQDDGDSIEFCGFNNRSEQ